MFSIFSLFGRDFPFGLLKINLKKNPLFVFHYLCVVRKRHPFSFTNDPIELFLASKEDEEATEMLIGNAQNLNLSVKATVEAAKAATIKIRADSGLRFEWVRKPAK